MVSKTMKKLNMTTKAGFDYEGIPPGIQKRGRFAAKPDKVPYKQDGTKAGPSKPSDFCSNATTIRDEALRKLFLDVFGGKENSCFFIFLPHSYQEKRKNRNPAVRKEVKAEDKPFGKE